MIPDEAPRFGGDRYVVLGDLGPVGVGSLHEVWDQRLRMWRLGLHVRAELVDDVQDSARRSKDLRHPSLLRVHDTCEEWVVLEHRAALPLHIDAPWPADEAVAAVAGLGRAIQTLHEADLPPDAIAADSVLWDGEALVLPPLLSGSGDPSNTHAARSLGALLASLVRGSDGDELPAALASLRPAMEADLSAFLRALDAFEAPGAPPSWVVDEPVRDDSLPEPEPEPPPPPPPARRSRARFFLVGVALALVALFALLGVPVWMVGSTASSLLAAEAETLASEAVLAEQLTLEEGALEELEALSIEVDPIQRARGRHVVHGGSALLEAIEHSQQDELRDEPEARILAQRGERLRSHWTQAADARERWRQAAGSSWGRQVVRWGLAEPYEPLPGEDRVE